VNKKALTLLAIFVILIVGAFILTSEDEAPTDAVGTTEQSPTD
jgi:hypothetical protein